MLSGLSGATLIVPIVGDPIAQVRSPAGVTAAFAARGLDIVCVPMHVAPADFPVFIALARAWQNCPGLIITVPHKFAAFSVCDRTTPRATFLETVNTISRDSDGKLHGDMLDGLGLVAACRAEGCSFEGKRALLVGAGGAGTAIGHAMASAGVAGLGIADLDELRRDRLVSRLRAASLPAHVAPADGTGYDIVVNATPMGMRNGDPLPVPELSLSSTTFVGDVVTAPDPSPFIAAARRVGCATSTGHDMFDEVRDLMVEYLLAADRQRPPIGPGEK